jgi:cytoskeletal protein RodZ
MRIQGRIRKQRRIQEEYEKRQREDVTNAIVLGVGVLIGGGVLIWISFLYMT